MSTYEHGTFFWRELLTADVPAAVAFYTEVVGWRTEPFAGLAGYTMWLGEQGPLGGVLKLDPAAGLGTRPTWIASVQVEDVDGVARRAQERGGRVCSAPEDVPDVGRAAVVADPQGALLSIFRPARAMEVHDAAQDGEFCWSELQTPDAAAAVSFYGGLLGWTVLQEMDMGALGTYRIFGIGGQRLGGIYPGSPGPGQPATWLYYASTGDLEGAIARATRRGAKLVLPPSDVPGGRMAQLVDPQGAAFALHQAATR